MNKLPEGVLVRPNGQPMCPYVAFITNKCIHCRIPIGDKERGYALGGPYYGLLHETCLQFFSFDNKWPHDYPAACYSAPFLSPQNQ